jgi:hypothetical protein
MNVKKNVEDVGATAFDLDNSQNPTPHAPIYYGDNYVPRPTNFQAKMVDHKAVMRAVNEGK